MKKLQLYDLFNFIDVRFFETFLQIHRVLIGDVVISMNHGVHGHALP